MTDNRFRITEDVLIIGNQAADLDSSVSAFALAAFLSRINPGILCHPLIQGAPDDLRLKPEIKGLFRRAGINLKPEHFSFFYLNDDFRMENSNSQKPEKVIMVDHNEPDSQEINHGIIGIVDHHKDSFRYQNLALRDIRLCGSCASIISEYWQTMNGTCPYSISLLLAGAIAVDTGYLDQAWGKTTDLDRREYERLLKILKPEDRSYILNLLAVKNDLSHLNISDHLRRDYKDFPLEDIKAGIASLPVSQRDFFRNGFYDEKKLKDFKEQNCPDILLIMHTIPEPFSRELSVYAENHEMLERIKTALERIEHAGFSAADSYICNSSEKKKWAFYKQKNIKISRKGLVPLLRVELENLMGQ